MKAFMFLTAFAFLIYLAGPALAGGVPVSTDKAPAAIGPYSQAVWAGNVLFLSGQIGLDPSSGKLVSGGTLAQAEQVFKNISAILESQKLGLQDVVKVTVFGTDIKEFPEVNKLYATFFPKNPPARSFVQAGALPAGATIEIEVVAYRDKRRVSKSKKSQ
ncbi:MAG: Rid family detoxifying hydrolase [Desulfovibrio sp.]|jgi:2-iminobutanoate/2-iminopropanoate deaminase|nr:Rid family detoxifying hydrolase [Desulfovibrio sp.]